MPKRKRGPNSKRPTKRRRMVRRAHARMSRRLYAKPSAGFPYQKFVTLSGFCRGVITPPVNATNTISYMAFTMDNPYQFLEGGISGENAPDSSFTINNFQANCVPQWGSFYEDFCVLGSQAKVTYQLPADQTWQVGSIVLQEGDATAQGITNTNIDQFIENKRGSYRTVPQYNTNTVSSVCNYSPKKLLGIKDPSDDKSLVRSFHDGTSDPESGQVYTYGKFYVTSNKIVAEGSQPVIPFILRMTFFLKLMHPKIVEMNSINALKVGA